MGLSELEIKRCEKAIDKFMKKRRPPAYMRNKVDLGYRVTGQSVELFEIRPHWQDNTKSIESPIARATFVKSRGLWKIFWKRSDLKWHRYDPDPEVKRIEDFLAVVDRDEYGCFFG